MTDKDDKVLGEKYEKLSEMAFGRGSGAINILLKDFISKVAELDTRGVVPFAFTSITEPKLKKTGNPYKKVYKVSQVNVLLGVDYEAQKNRELEKQGLPATFVAGPRAWGEHFTNSIVVHNGKYYLVVNIQGSHSVYINVKEDGSFETLDKTLIQPFLPTPSTSDNKYHTYSFGSIVSGTLDKQEYVVEDVDQIRKDILAFLKIWYQKGIRAKI